MGYAGCPLPTLTSAYPVTAMTRDRHRAGKRLELLLHGGSSIGHAGAWGRTWGAPCLARMWQDPIATHRAELMWPHAGAPAPTLPSCSQAWPRNKLCS